MKGLLDAIVYLLIRLFLGLVGWLPAGLAYPFCEALATLVFWLDKKHRRIGMINLGIAFPEKDQRWKQQVLRRSFQQIGDHVVELSRLWGQNATPVAQREEYERSE